MQDQTDNCEDLNIQPHTASETECVYKPRLLVLAAGTGGHVYPALSVADYLVNKGWHIDWLGTDTGIENRLVAEAGYPLHKMKIKGIRGKRLSTFLPNIWHTVVAIISAWRLVGKLEPDVVLGMGGYVAGPAGIAAFLRRKPLLLHEQNAIAGLTNRLLKPLANVVMQAFPTAFSGANVITVGNPLRAAFTEAVALANQDKKSDMTPSFNLLVVGGSLGALAINQVMPECFSLLQKTVPYQHRQINLWHQCGEAHWQDTQTAYKKYENLAGAQVSIDAFIDNMSVAFAWADVIVCRAGALTVSELAAAGKPSVLIPYPYAVDDHQTANAHILVQAGAGVVITANALSAEHLVQVLLPLIENTKARKAMSLAAKTIAKPLATETVAKQCIEAVNGSFK